MMELQLYTKLLGNTARYPYVVGVQARQFFGSGILLSEKLVLTCHHTHIHEDLLIAGTKVHVITPTGAIPAGVRFTDEWLDLALIELEHSVPFAAARFSEAPLSEGEMLMAVGVQPQNDDTLLVAGVPLKYFNSNEAGGECLDMQLQGAARPGYSGGPVLLEQKGISHCVGLIRTGGTWAASSNAIGLSPIIRFLERHLPGNTLLKHRDQDRAIDRQQLEEAAIAGDPESQYQWALLHERQQAELATQWLRKAAEKGHAESAFRMVLAYREGNGVLPSKQEAIRWLRRAAQLGHPEAQAKLGQMLLDGSAGYKDAMEAASFLEQSSAQANASARFQLALLYYRGDQGIPKRHEMAFKLMRQVAPEGLPAAQYYLAEMYALGRGTPINTIEALRWAQAALNQQYEAARKLVRDLSQR